ncbi:MAG: NADH-quinone oxidoreductase subunit NuoE [Candidatus Eisenbacteria sp.]|nr:NADH-quinone oxidoreductase subunit NuoE [Candidatus Eisenbacteria bacterium]
MDPETLERLDCLIDEAGLEETDLIGAMQDIQRELNYLPEEAMRLVAQKIGVPLSQVYSIATFYKTFSLEPRGRHLINVCMGTACHVRGGVQILEKLKRILGIDTGGTTNDQRFSLEAVRCLGCCGLAPVIMIDGKFHGKLTQKGLDRILEQYE